MKQLRSVLAISHSEPKNNRVFWAGFLTEAAKDTSNHVDLVMFCVAFAVRDGIFRIVFGGLQEDGPGRTYNAA